MGKGRRYDQEYKDMIVELFKLLILFKMRG